MGSRTKIAWCDATFNPWRGCAKISAGCAHCYAEQQAKRNPAVLGQWGPDAERVIAAESYWKTPYLWDRQAAAEGENRKVFCGSLMDIFEDRPELVEPRRRLFGLSDDTRWLKWLLVTKRPEDIQRLWADTRHTYTASDGKRHGRMRDNVWLLASVEDQAAADRRVPELLKCHGLAPVLGLSCEPLLGPLDLRPWLGPVHCDEIEAPQLPSGYPWPYDEQPWYDGIKWVIVGGESGPGARPCQIEWVRSIVQQCEAARVPCFVKQLGSLAVMDYYGEDGLRERCLESNGRVFEPVRGGWSEWDWRRDRYQPRPGTVLELRLKHTKGGDPSEWPQDVNVREFPCLA